MVAGALTAACGDDGSSTDGEGGAGGRDTTTATTGSTTSTTSGPTTTATTSTMTTTSTMSTTNSSSSTGEGGMGTGGMGTGGMGQGGGGTGGGSGCIAITPTGFALDQANGSAARYLSIFTPNVDGVEDDLIGLELYGDTLDGGDPGTFDLTMNGDENYATCARCFRAFVDPEGANPRVFFQSAGTLEVASGLTPLDGSIDATVTGLTLIEVTIDPTTFVSTPVPGGDCFEIATADVQVGPPAGWTCNLANYGTNDGCDCGCGVVDPDCPDALAASCEYCVQGLSCANDGTVEGCEIPILDPNNSAVCTGVPSAWVCDPADYNSGLANDCNCGCGIVDPDCADDTTASCDLCNDTGSCAAGETDCSTIDPANNAECASGVPAGWNCNPLYYGDTDCDCGCGVLDIDCANATSAVCDFCNDSGSCASTCSDIDPANNAVCTPGPVGWTCDPDYYDSGFADDCDCGCGIPDPDCDNALPATCDYCESGGSCANNGTSTFGCNTALLLPNDNSVCQ
ncbi:MAG: hypothetical protein HOV80_02830 [Polyangiaceae bacterium]|nr:hypothetical protein [Polyangiaceae bacterium]